MAIAVVVLAIVVAGAAVAIVLSNHNDTMASSNQSGTVSRADSTTSTTAPTSTTATVTVTTPTTTEGTITPTTTTAGETPDRGRLVIGENYSVRIPSAWNADGPLDVYHAATKPTENSYRESRWESPDDGNTYIHIDYTTDFRGDNGDASRQVRRNYHKGHEYRERSFGPIVLNDGREAWRWRYARLQDGVYVEKADYFLSGCHTGYAFVGVAPAERWPQMAGVYLKAVNSLHPRC